MESIQQKKRASKIKVAQITIQEPKIGCSISFIVAARPQATNESSSFTHDMSSICRKWVKQFNPCASFVGTVTDGVSTETQFIDKSIDEFFCGNQDDVAMTDCNHNAKSIRYQLLSSLCTMGCLHFDPGLICLTDLLEDTWRIKDFSDDGKVLKLASHKTVQKLSMLTNKDGCKVAGISLFLYFLGMKLFSINAKNIPCEHRVIYLVSALCFFTSVKGMSIITVRTWFEKSSQLFFIREDCPHPRLATSEPLEHKFGTIRTSHGKFTCAMFPGIVEKEAIANAAMAESSLRNGRHTNRCGYMSTANEAQSFFQEPVKHWRNSGNKISTSYIRTSGLSVCKNVWFHSTLTEMVNDACTYVRRFLKGLGCTYEEMSPFLKMKWDRTEDSLVESHRTLKEYRANSISQVNDQEQIEPLITDKCPDMAINIAARKDELCALLLNELLSDEKSICKVDLEGLDSASVAGGCDDNISLSSIDGFNNLMETTVPEAGISSQVSSLTAYHKSVCATVSKMTCDDAMEYISTIVDGIAELGMKDQEKGVDSMDTKQKTSSFVGCPNGSPHLFKTVQLMKSFNAM